MRLVAYLRVSTERQADEGLGLDVQEQSIRRWAEANGHEVVLWTRDEGVSGTKSEAERLGLSEALRTVQDGDVDGVVVARLDRLARLLTVQEATLGRIWHADGHLFTVDAGEVLRDDPADPMRTAMRQMLGVFAELERGMIAARLAAGRRLKAERGGYAFGAPPIGYAAIDGELVPVEAEQVPVRRILRLRGEGATTRVIADALNREGLVTKRGCSWQSAQVARVIRRESSRLTAKVDGVR